MKLKYHGRNPFYGVSMYRSLRGPLWQARAYMHGQKLNLGTFETAERASLAVRLFCHWRAAGYSDIPVQNTTRDAI